jgi:hypothetical protein
MGVLLFCAARGAFGTSAWAFAALPLSSFTISNIFPKGEDPFKESLKKSSSDSFLKNEDASLFFAIVSSILRKISFMMP